MSGRAWWWWLTVLLMAAAATGAFLVARNLQPEPLVDVDAVEEPVFATVSVERRVLSEPVVFRADVVALESRAVDPPSLSEGSVPRVTSVDVGIGDEVTGGDVLVTVADRPIIALQGAVPMYRDIRPSVRGSDVIQLQTALNALGYETEVDGLFGRATEAAVARFYEDRGFDLPETGGDEQLDTLRADVQAAENAGDREALRRARNRLADAEATVGRYVPAGELAFLPRLPVQILAVPQLGSVWDVEEPPLVVTASSLVLRGLVPVELEPLLSVGSPGEATVESTGETIPVAVESIGTDTVADEAGVRVRVSLVPETPIPFELEGSNLLVVVSAAGLGEEVLAVPISAVYTSSDGQAFLMSVEGSEIPVELGASVGGWVEITDGSVAPGEQVVIGYAP